MDSLDEFEIKAEAFRLMTGMMAPGKDVPSVFSDSEESFEVRAEAYADWQLRNIKCIAAMIVACERVIGLPKELEE